MVDLVEDINAQGPTIKPVELAEIGGTLMFSGTESINGTELWRVDPNSGEAELVAAIRSGGLSSSPARLTDVGGVALFVADGGSHGRELWRSDGTSAGTIEVAYIYPGPSDSMPNFPGDEAPYLFTGAGGELYFEANDGVQGFALWRSDGTAAGTTAVPISGDPTLASDPAVLTCSTTWT